MMKLGMEGVGWFPEVVSVQPAIVDPDEEEYVEVIRFDSIIQKS